MEILSIVIVAETSRILYKNRPGLQKKKDKKSKFLDLKIKSI